MLPNFDLQLNLSTFRGLLTIRKRSMLMKTNVDKLTNPNKPPAKPYILQP